MFDRQFLTNSSVATVRATQAITCLHIKENGFQNSIREGLELRATMTRLMDPHNLALGSVDNTQWSLACSNCLLEPNMHQELAFLLHQRATVNREIVLVFVAKGAKPLPSVSETL